MQVYDSDILGTKNMDFESVPWKNGLFFIFSKWSSTCLFKTHILDDFGYLSREQNPTLNITRSITKAYDLDLMLS